MVSFLPTTLTGVCIPLRAASTLCQLIKNIYKLCYHQIILKVSNAETERHQIEKTRRLGNHSTKKKTKQNKKKTADRF